MLGEEHDLPGAAGQLRGVVGREPRLRLTDAPHHAEDVLVRGRRPARPLPGGDLPHEVVVDALDGPAAGSRLQRLLVARDETTGQALLRGPDGTAGLVVELHRHVGDAAGGQVGGHVHLASPHDAALDDGGAGGGGEAPVGRRETDLLERLHQLTDRAGLVDPAEELPDRREVLDVVDQRRAGEGHEQGVAGPRADALGEAQDVLGPLRLAVLDVVGLVDDHPAQAQLPEPAHVPVEHLVVDDDDVREAVDRVPVAVDHRGPVGGGPQRGLARPVHLDHVRHDDEQRVGVRRLGGEQRLRRLAQAGLVGQQERPVARRGRGDHPRLVRHELEPVGQQGGGRLRQVHARERPTVLEGPQQRLDELPAGEAAGPGRAPGDGGEVGREEGVGALTGEHRRGHHLSLHGRRGLGRRGLLDGFLRHLDAGLLEELAAQRPCPVGDDGVVGEQAEEGGVAGGGRRQDGGDAVEALELLGTPRRRHLPVRLDAGPFLTHEERHHLELRPDRGGRAAAPDRGLDLADHLGEHLDRAVGVVARPAPGAGAGVVLARACAVLTRACAAGTLGSSSHELLLRSGRSIPGGTWPAPHPQARTPGSPGRRRPRERAGPADLQQIDASEVSSRDGTTSVPRGGRREAITRRGPHVDRTSTRSLARPSPVAYTGPRTPRAVVPH